MEVSTEKSKIISAYIGMIGQKLEEVTSFKYLGSTLCEDGTCPAEDCIRIAQQWQQCTDLTGSSGATSSALKQAEAPKVSCHHHPPLRI